MKMILPFAAVGVFALGGCNTVVTSDMQAALAQACPIVALVQADTALKLNADQKAALTAIELACPPNPPPTSTLVAASDILSAYAILAPLVH